MEEPFFFFGRGRPGEESANGRRAVGVKVDVVGVGGGGMGGGVLGWGWGWRGGSERFLPLPDNAAPYQAVVRALGPTRAPGTLVLGGSGI